MQTIKSIPAPVGISALFALFLTQGASAQGPAVVPRDGSATPKPAAARLSGRVVAADTGKPLRGAVVHIVSSRAANPNERQTRWVTTDRDGRWELGALTAGRYTVGVAKGGYLTVQYGQQRPFERGKTLEIADGQSLDRIDVALPRGGVITGRIVDDAGDPVASAFVRAVRYRYVDGQRQLTPLAEGLEGLLTGGGGAVTDDLGQYRLYGLAPGEYYVSALFNPPGESANRTGYPPSFYPGTTTAADAQRVAVRIAQETQNVSFNLAPTRYAVVAGSVIGSAGTPVRASVALTSTELTAGSPVAPTVAAADGTFAIENVPPGEYRLQVWYTGNDVSVSEFATLPVSVTGQDLTALTIVTAPGATASGRVVFEGGVAPDVRLWVRTAAAVPGATTLANSSVGVRPDLTFEARGLVARQTFRPGNLPEGWFLRSVMHEGRDITDSGYDFTPGQSVADIDIILTQRATTLSGTVRDRERQIADYTVVAFSTDSSRWGYQTRFVRSIRPDQSGSFSFRGLPPADYYLIALEYVETGQEMDPEQLEKWKPFGTRVTLADGESSSIVLKLTR